MSEQLSPEVVEILNSPGNMTKEEQATVTAAFRGLPEENRRLLASRCVRPLIEGFSGLVFSGVDPYVLAEALVRVTKDMYLYDPPGPEIMKLVP
jgi:hypothetical protein